jgi:uncharacterized delta-60 repeat protein
VPAGGVNSINQVLIQPDGKILVASDGVPNGLPAGLPGVFRLDLDGSFDGGFQRSGHSTSAIQSLADGRIVAGGEGVYRYLSNGQADPTFTLPTVAGRCYALAIQGDGKMILAGDITSVNSTTRPSLARLNQDGSLNLFFAPKGTSGGTRWMKLQSTGAIVAASSTAVGRWFSDGTRDTTFSPDRGSEAISGLDVDSSDRIYFSTGGAIFRFSGQNRLIGSAVQIPTLLQSSDAVDSNASAWATLKSVPANTPLDYILPAPPTVGNLFYRVQPAP